MKRTRRLLEMIEALITLTVLASAVSASAGTLGNEKGLAWASQRDLTSQQCSEAFDDYRQRGCERTTRCTPSLAPGARPT